MVLAAVIVLLLFAFLLTTAALAFVYSSNLMTFSKEHRMVALERAESGLNKGALDLTTLHADLPEEITLPTDYSHADYVEFLDGLDDAYYVEVAGGDYRYYLTDDMAVIGYGWRQDFKRIIRCEYYEQYFPVLETPAALYIDANNASSTFDGNAFRINGNDHTATGSPMGGGNDKYGVLTTSPAASTGITSGLSGPQNNRVDGIGANPSVGTDTTVPVDIDAFSAQLDDIADTIYEGYTKITGDEFFGSPDYPTITIINGDMEIGGTINGWGILDIRGDLIAGAGNVTWTGLLIVHGKSSWVHGTPNVIGSMWLKSPNVDLRVSGNPYILYSTEALTWYSDPGIRLDFKTWEEL
jgi:hypothetical protein